ncbi:MAG: hypothetical protein AAFY63_22905 [Cyanobacteria bacterium J06643_13]
MKPKKIIGLVAVGLILPSTAIALSNSVLASEVKVKTANVEAVTRSDGSVYIDTGGTTLSVPRHSSHRYSSRRSWSPWRYWKFPWQSFSSDRDICRHSSYQSTRQTTHGGGSTVQSSSYSHSCN